MRKLLLLTILTINFLSCKTNKDEIDNNKKFKIVITDTTNNIRAKWDLDDFNYRSRLENQLGLSNLQNGADSFEIRLWYDFSFSNSQHLYTLKFIDTNCVVSFFRVYPRREVYDEKTKTTHWLPFKDRFIDSSFSKSVTISNFKYKSLHLDSVWTLKSQSDLKISDSIGFTDCDSYIIEIADKQHLKYLMHHCSNGYYEKTKLNAILDFQNFCSRIVSLARENDVYIEEKFID